MQYDANNKEMDKKKIHASHTRREWSLKMLKVSSIFGVAITNDSLWNTITCQHNICTKANQTLGFLRRNLYTCQQEVKEAAYTCKGLVYPVLEYGSSVLDPLGVDLQDELEKVQNPAARFVTGNYNN